MALFDISIVWFRRDLRSFDHAALHHALQKSRQVFCVFVFDREILDSLPRADRRVEFIHACVTELNDELHRLGGSLIVRHGFASLEIPELVSELRADAVFVNHDYEPTAISRDEDVAIALASKECAFFSFKDHVIFEKSEVLSQSVRPFSVFTPYKNSWLKNLHLQTDVQGNPKEVGPFQIDPYANRLASVQSTSIPSLSKLGFEKTNISMLPIPTGMRGGRYLIDDFMNRIADYGNTRDFPAVKGPSYLSMHLRFGTVSIRYLVRCALNAIRSGEGGNGASVWLSELIWRDFYAMILFHHPRVVYSAFKPSYDLIKWNSGVQADIQFNAWCEGRTGYPLVDAAMAQLNQTGYMHNRLRMVTACFLIKDLGIDWRRGEHYFAEKLNDYDLASNNGGWQWASSSGCDAQPYFRIFNPVTQSEKFDAEGKFIRRYLPKLAKLSNKAIHAPWLLTHAELKKADIVLGTDYPAPIVEHEAARKLTLERYAVTRTLKNGLLLL
jgi:deoxyribodipyrimidine photo-lyase